MTRIFLIVFMLCFHESLMAQEIKVLTYNIHHAINMRGELDLSSIIRVINDQKPDLVALQELDSNFQRSDYVDQLPIIARKTKMNYIRGWAGNGILSRYPISDSIRIKIVYDEYHYERGFTVAKVMIDQKEVMFMCTHLDHTSDTVRLSQLNAIFQYLPSQTNYMIFAGDFNFQPGSLPYQKLCKQFVDLDAKDHSPTYPANKPSARIDYIFLHKKSRIESSGYQVIAEKAASDHRPVVSKLKLN